MSISTESGRRSTPRFPSIRNPSSLRNSPAPLGSGRRCPGCTDADIREDSGQMVCFSCGTVISDSIIVNDITFGEAPSGAALVQGTTVHAGQRYAKTNSTSLRFGARTYEEAQDSSLRAAKDEMTRLAGTMNISAMVDRAIRVFRIARIHHFQRPILESVAICLYITCRQTKGNTILLIDFAEKIKRNVFDLGSLYKKFVRSIGLDSELEKIPVVEIEPLLYKYAKRLEFGHATRQVANDAALILSRMDRDWMVTGRQPPALCGAAIILAARMNNFRRSIRELVYVVKTGDATIAKRLQEFRRTKAGRLTVSQFRQYAHRLKGQAEPPAVYEARERAEKKKLALLESQAVSPPESRSGNPQTQQSRLDSDGFAIPDVPAHLTPMRPGRSRNNPLPSDLTAQQQVPAPRRKPGRPRKRPPPEGSPEQADEESPAPKKKRKTNVIPDPIEITEDDLQIESQLEKEIIQIVDQHIHEKEFEVTEARARVIAEAELGRSTQYANEAWNNKEILDDEFEDDPDVSNCLLTPEEIEVKEKIWVTHNHDWLRMQQERMLDLALEEAIGKKKKQKAKPKIHLGPASTPAEASHRMLEKKHIRPAFSKHINYEKLQKIYGLGDGDSRSTSEASIAVSPAPSTTQPQKPKGPPPQDDPNEDEEEYDEENEEDEDEEEEDYESDTGAGARAAGFGVNYDDGIIEEQDIDYDELGIDYDEYE